MALPSANLMQDIITRFVLTSPEEQLTAIESIMFLIEQAHWYYEDHLREQNSTLKGLSLKDFAKSVLEEYPDLNINNEHIDQIMEKFKAFKKNVPVMGGMLLDKTLQRVLLVKGWKNTACWGFPRGKIHENETDTQCAVREVLEETGYDIESLVNDNDFIELYLEGKRNKLYIVAGLDPDSAQFAPKCKGEIGGYAWHRVADLPATRDEGNQTFRAEDGTKHKFYNVWQYIKPLRRWIKRRQQNTVDWDMPGPNTPVVQQTGPAGPSMHQPYYPQQVQQLLNEHNDNQPAGGSPRQRPREIEHQQQNLTTQQRQQQPVENQLAVVLQQPGITTPNKQAKTTAGGNNGSAAKSSFPGPLSALFSAAGPGRTNMCDTSRQFCFDRQAIMRALVQ